MRTPVEDEYDRRELDRLNAKPWQVELLNYNPDYPFWGPHEDYMCGGSGWEKPVIVSTWAEFEFGLDDLNEVVNFYFELRRASRECEVCRGTGDHPDAMWVSKSFYCHSSPFAHGEYPDEDVVASYNDSFREFCEEMRTRDGGRSRVGCWNDLITEDEADKLVEEGRGWKYKTAEEFNRAQNDRGIGHDAINREILVEERLKRFGIPVHCPECDGYGEVFTAPDAHVALVLWVIHPRKGASRGVEVQRVEEGDLPAIWQYLHTAAARNSERFGRIPT